MIEHTYESWLDRRGLEDTPERRALWHRRYTQPEPPTGLGLLDIRQAQRDVERRWLADGWLPRRYDDDCRPDAWYEPKPPRELPE